MTYAEMFAPVLQGLGVLIAGVVAGLFAIYTPRVIATFERLTKIKLTDQQRQIVLGAADTAKGIIESKIQQGVLKISDVTEDNPIVIKEASAARARVPDAAAGLALTDAAMASIVVGRVDTSGPKKPDIVVVPTVAVPAPVMKLGEIST